MATAPASTIITIQAQLSIFRGFPESVLASMMRPSLAFGARQEISNRPPERPERQGADDRDVISRAGKSCKLNHLFWATIQARTIKLLPA